MDRYVPLPPVPDRISRLNELAWDLWWSWTPQAREVFRDPDFPLWRFTDHNPVLLLHLVDAERLEHAVDPEFLRLYDKAVAGLDAVRAGRGTWWSNQVDGVVQPIMFVAPEFALPQGAAADARRAWQDIRGPRSEVRGPRSEVRGPRSEVRSPKSEVRSPKSEVRSPKSEVRSPNAERRNSEVHCRSMSVIAETARLRLREMVAEDLDFVAAMLADPDVSRYYARRFTRQDAQVWLDRQLARYARDGHGLWVLEARETGEPLGQAGLALQEVEGERHPEIGWLLHRPYWGHGYATEAGAAARDLAFTRWRYPYVISLIRPANMRSRAVAERLGMQAGREAQFHGFTHLVYSTERGS